MSNKNLNRSKDLSLFYFGGSGGFLLLHLLLMSGAFYAAGVDIDKLEQQWDIQDPAKWKDNEVWPNNAATALAVTDKTKLYFNCNNYDSWINNDQTRAFLYVDLDTQLKLSKYKNAWCYNNKILTQTEIDSHVKKINETAVNIEHKRYFAKVPELVEQADIAINLLDLLSTPTYELFKFGLTLNPRQIQLLKHWTSLHNGNLT